MKVSRIPEVPESDGNSPLMIGGNVTRQAITPDVQSFNCAIVNFSKGARNKFHAHSGDQVLIITSGMRGSIGEHGGCVNLHHWHASASPRSETGRSLDPAWGANYIASQTSRLAGCAVIAYTGAVNTAD